MILFVYSMIKVIKVILQKDYTTKIRMNSSNQVKPLPKLPISFLQRIFYMNPIKKKKNHSLSKQAEQSKFTHRDIHIKSPFYMKFGCNKRNCHCQYHRLPKVSLITSYQKKQIYEHKKDFYRQYKKALADQIRQQSRKYRQMLKEQLPRIRYNSKYAFERSKSNSNDKSYSDSLHKSSCQCHRCIFKTKLDTKNPTFQQIINYRKGIIQQGKPQIQRFKHFLVWKIKQHNNDTKKQSINRQLQNTIGVMSNHWNIQQITKYAEKLSQQQLKKLDRILCSGGNESLENILAYLFQAFNHFQKVDWRKSIFTEQSDNSDIKNIQNNRVITQNQTQQKNNYPNIDPIELNKKAKSPNKNSKKYLTSKSFANKKTSSKNSNQLKSQELNSDLRNKNVSIEGEKQLIDTNSIKDNQYGILEQNNENSQRNSQINNIQLNQSLRSSTEKQFILNNKVIIKRNRKDKAPFNLSFYGSKSKQNKTPQQNIQDEQDSSQKVVQTNKRNHKNSQRKQKRIQKKQKTRYEVLSQMIDYRKYCTRDSFQDLIFTLEQGGEAEQEKINKICKTLKIQKFFQKEKDLEAALKIFQPLIPQDLKKSFLKSIAHRKVKYGINKLCDEIDKKLQKIKPLEDLEYQGYGEQQYAKMMKATYMKKMLGMLEKDLQETEQFYRNKKHNTVVQITKTEGLIDDKNLSHKNLMNLEYTPYRQDLELSQSNLGQAVMHQCQPNYTKSIIKSISKPNKLPTLYKKIFQQPSDQKFILIDRENHKNLLKFAKERSPKKFYKLAQGLADIRKKIPLE